MISIVVPTYDEKENIEKLIFQISETMKGYDYEIIIVDDNSPDGTAEIAQKLSYDYPMTVLKRDGKLGLASAIIHGFQNAKGNVLGVIDADLQHPPEHMKEFIQEVNNGFDIAIGSRYATGGYIEGWTKLRILTSKGAILLSRGLTDVKDPMSGYFFLKRNVIENISFNPIGYKLLLEILVKGSYNYIKEIPYGFRSRENGRSKLNRGEYASFIKLLYHLYGFKLLNLISNFKNR